MLVMKLTEQEKHTWKDSKYGIQANDLAMAESGTETETEKTPKSHSSVWPWIKAKSVRETLTWQEAIHVKY